MPDTEMSYPTLFERLTGLPPQERRHLATTLRRVSETCAEVPDGKST